MYQCREASPGKLGPLEDELFRHSEMADAPIVMAVALGYAEVGSLGTLEFRSAGHHGTQNASCYIRPGLLQYMQNS